MLKRNQFTLSCDIRSPRKSASFDFCPCYQRTEAHMQISPEKTRSSLDILLSPVFSKKPQWRTTFPKMLPTDTALYFLIYVPDTATAQTLTWKVVLFPIISRINSRGGKRISVLGQRQEKRPTLGYRCYREHGQICVMYRTSTLIRAITAERDHPASLSIWSQGSGLQLWESEAADNSFHAI